MRLNFQINSIHLYMQSKLFYFGARIYHTENTNYITVTVNK